jgi:hypothetical protein
MDLYTSIYKFLKAKDQPCFMHALLKRFFLLLLFCTTLFSHLSHAQRLQVSANKRFLVKEDGSPFFYLGDTAWELFHKLNREDADLYLQNRAAKGFTVIQAVLLAEINGLTEPNAYGDLPLINLEPSKLYDGYFQHVDYILNKARELNLYMAVLPTWGAHVVKENHPLFPNHPIFDTANARTYGQLLGRRYRDYPNIIWMLGGDRKPEGYETVWEAMAKGLREGDGGKHLITYHSTGETSSSQWFHKAGWLDFNTIQSGHGRRANPNYEMITSDYNRSPAKPTFDGEPNYEDAGVGFMTANGVFTDHDIRNSAYWSVFAGGFGYTYGAGAIWQMYTKESKGVLTAPTDWKTALDLPGANQLRHLKSLLFSRPYLTRIPDQGLILSANNHETDHLQATRDGTPGKNNATYVMVYTPTARFPKINTTVFAGKRLRAWWFDPREGIAYSLGEVENKGTYEPGWNHQPWKPGAADWVLVIDDAAKNYPPPGTPISQRN